MFIELIDALRCTVDHADSWLVASISRRDERFVMEGVLGCPVCLREYPLERGVAWFTREPRKLQQQQEGTGNLPEYVRTAPEGDLLSANGGTHSVMSIGAFLSVREGATIVLAGDWARTAHGLSELLPLRIFAINPPEPIYESESVAVLMSDEGIPLGRGLAHGVALDSTTASATWLTTAMRVLVDGGHLVAPAHVEVPDDISILARDEHFWVGDKRPALVSLRHR